MKFINILLLVVSCLICKDLLHEIDIKVFHIINEIYEYESFHNYCKDYWKLRGKLEVYEEMRQKIENKN